MALLPLAEAIVRTVYPGGIPGSTIWVQHLALWVAFLGAAIAARRGELLSLTAGAQLAGARSRAWIDVVVGGISVAVCVVLLYGSLVLWDLLLSALRWKRTRFFVADLGGFVFALILGGLSWSENVALRTAFFQPVVVVGYAFWIFYSVGGDLRRSHREYRQHFWEQYQWLRSAGPRCREAPQDRGGS